MLASLALTAALGAAALPAPSSATWPQVIELRQYKIIPGRRDDMIAVFESHLIEGQERVGMQVLGTFRDLDSPDRFTWLRGFSSFVERAPALQAFYTGSDWLAYRGQANPLLEDNDNVLLLKPASPRLGSRKRAVPATAGSDRGVLVVTIHYLWKDPSEGFTHFFESELAPALARHGLDVQGAFVPERTPNDFPRLPVRQHENVFVWFAYVPDTNAHASAWKALEENPEWSASLKAALGNHEERARQVLRLAPTSASAIP